MADLCPHCDADIDRLEKADVDVGIPVPDTSDVTFWEMAYKCPDCDVILGVTGGHTNEF